MWEYIDPYSEIAREYTPTKQQEKAFNNMLLVIKEDIRYINGVYALFNGTSYIISDTEKIEEHTKLTEIRFTKNGVLAEVESDLFHYKLFKKQTFIMV